MVRKYKQGYNSRLNESIGARNKGYAMSQPMKSRRHESEGMEKYLGKPKFSANKHSVQKRRKKKH
jgi:hypothetical protein